MIYKKGIRRVHWVYSKEKKWQGYRIYDTRLFWELCNIRQEDRECELYKDKEKRLYLQMQPERII